MKESKAYELILNLFDDFLKCNYNLCVVKTDLYGYVLLGNAESEVIRESYICDNPKKLYDRLLSEWEMDTCFKMSVKNEQDDFTDLYSLLSEQQLEDLATKKQLLCVGNQKYMKERKHLRKKKKDSR